MPALRASRPAVVESLKAGGREGGAAVSRLRVTLMTAQAALSVILLVGAGLFVRSLRQAANVQLGFQPSGVLAGSLDVTPLGYKAPSRLALYASMRERVASLPGVADAAYATTYPLLGFALSIARCLRSSTSLTVAPGGFSRNTCLPASMASRAAR